MAVFRAPQNPIITPKDVKPSRPDMEVVCVFNAGVTRFNDEVILLMRVAERPINTNEKVYLSPVLDLESGDIVIKQFKLDNPDYDFSDSRVIKVPGATYLTSISHLRVARSKDGINFTIEEAPAIKPENLYEMLGVEDPRITLIDGLYYISYSAISHIGITTCLASTKDFKTFEKHGVIFHPDNKDVELFPEKINGKYYALHRPSPSHFGTPDIWIAESPDLKCWGNHKHLMGIRQGFWDNGRVGGSAVPFRVNEGWIEVYHGATKENKYCLGAVLLDANEPWKIIARSEKPIIEPEEDYEVNGFFGNVIFNCGLLFEDNLLKIYYGAADTYIAYSEIPLEDVMKNLGL